MNTKYEQHNKKNLIQWRREKVQLLVSQGYSQRDIADQIKVSLGTVNKDLSFLREQAKENIKKYVDEKLPEEYEKCLTGLNSILRELWTISSNSPDKREKIQALSLAKECYSMKLDLLTNANVVNDVIRFISSSTNNNIVAVQSNIKNGSYTDERIIPLNNNSEPNGQNNTIDDKTKNKNIIENGEDDFQRTTEDNYSARESTYNSVF